MTIDMLGEKGHPWRQGPTLVLPAARYPWLSALATFSAGPVTLSLLMPV